MKLVPKFKLYDKVRLNSKRNDGIYHKVISIWNINDTIYYQLGYEFDLVKEDDLMLHRTTQDIIDSLE